MEFLISALKGPKFWFFAVVIGLLLPNEVVAKGLHGGMLKAMQMEETKMPNFLLNGILKNLNSGSCKNPEDVVQHWAQYILRDIPRTEVYYGTKATISVYELPEVKDSQSSAACIWVMNGWHLNTLRRNINKIHWRLLFQMNAIVVCWMIQPELYNDNHPHLFTAWTGDGFMDKCCIDTNCPGFVLTNKSDIVPGSRIPQASTYGGPQYDITLQVSKEKSSGNWWLYYGASGQYDKLIPVGYWPSSLFNTMATNASQLQWGGAVSYKKNEKSPPMGGGHFPNEGGKERAATFSRIQLVEKNGDLRGVDNAPEFELSKEKCFRVGDWVYNQFPFGGPGNCTN